MPDRAPGTTQRWLKRHPHAPFCDGGTATCEDCLASCGIEEYEVAALAEYEPLLALERVVRRIQVPDGRYRMIARKALAMLDEIRIDGGLDG